MNAEYVNPLDIKRPWILNSIFQNRGKILYVWLNPDSGELLFTQWDSLPEEVYHERPITRIYTGNYPESKALPCSGTLIYGPAAGGLGEAGAFKIQTCGERIDNLIPYLGFKRREMGRLVLNRKPLEATIFVERMVGQFSVSYASLFTILSSTLSDDCMRYISLALELERVHNHVWVAHKLAEDASQKVAAAHLAAMTEELLRLNLQVLGHRYGMGFLRLGPRNYGGFHRKIEEIHQEFVDLSGELLDSRIFVDRLHTTCRLRGRDILRHDLGGIPARAAGVPRDARSIGVMREQYGWHRTHVESEGDALSRLMVRVGEVDESLSFLENAEWGGCNYKPEDGFRYGVIEAPPGDAFMALRIEDGRVRDFMFRPASLPLYHGFSVGIKGNVFTDFPFALDSFGVYFADADSYGRWF